MTLTVPLFQYKLFVFLQSYFSATFSDYQCQKN